MIASSSAFFYNRTSLLGPQVYAATKASVEPLIAREVLAHNQALLDACHVGNWDTYVALSDPQMTAIESE